MLAAVHPAFVTVPVAWNCRGTYGLMYAKKPPAKVRALLTRLQQRGAGAGYSAPPTTKACG